MLVDFELAAAIRAWSAKADCSARVDLSGLQLRRFAVAAAPPRLPVGSPSVRARWHWPLGPAQACAAVERARARRAVQQWAGLGRGRLRRSHLVHLLGAASLDLSNNALSSVHELQMLPTLQQLSLEVLRSRPFRLFVLSLASPRISRRVAPSSSIASGASFAPARLPTSHASRSTTLRPLTSSPVGRRTPLHRMAPQGNGLRTAAALEPLGALRLRSITLRNNPIAEVRIASSSAGSVT